MPIQPRQKDFTTINILLQHKWRSFTWRAVTVIRSSIRIGRMYFICEQQSCSLFDASNDQHQKPFCTGTFHVANVVGMVKPASVSSI